MPHFPGPPGSLVQMANEPKWNGLPIGVDPCRLVTWAKGGLAAVLLLVASACTSGDERARENAFTAEVEAAFRARAPNLQISRTAPLELQVLNERGETWTYRLGSMHDDVLKDPAGRQRIIMRFVDRTLAYRPMALVADQATIIPVIRNRARANMMPTAAGAPILDPLSDEWVVAYTRGPTAGAAYVTEETLAQLGLTRDRLRNVAIENLRRIVGSIDGVEHHLFTMVTAGGAFDPSLVLFDELWRERRFAVEGDIVVAILEPDGLLVTGSKNAASIAHLKALANLGRPATSPPVRLLVYDGGGFRDLRD